MLLRARNFELIKNREATYLTSSVTAGDTTLTVRAVDSNSMSDNDWLIVGEIGTENAEVLQINGSVSDGTSLTIDNAGSGGSRYDHAIDEPVYKIDYNQVRFYNNATDTFSGATLLSTSEVQPDDEFTRYEDTSNTTGFGFVEFRNSDSSAVSDNSDGTPYTGYGPQSLGRIIKMIRRNLGEPDFKFLLDEEIREEVNEKQRDIAHERLWPFYEDIFSVSTVAYQRDYDIDTDTVDGKPHGITVKSDPLVKINAGRFDILKWDTAETGEPTHYNIWNNQIRLYPTPSSAAQTTAINDATDITATDTSVTVDSTSGFSPSGRIIIDSEVIGYTSTTSTSFLGLTRGLESTTAASHLDDAAITERDVVYTAHREPDELVDTNDQTKVPDPQVLIYGAAMELAAGKLQDNNLHDRLKLKYDQSLERLRDKFGRKGTQQYFRIKHKEEVVSDTGRFKNPNDFPTIS